MAEIDVTIKVETPLHLGSGQADVNLDAEIVHDAWGLPYFPAKRFKGLLFESAVEVFEMFTLANMSTENLAVPEMTEMFQTFKLSCRIFIFVQSKSIKNFVMIGVTCRPSTKKFSARRTF